MKILECISNKMIEITKKDLQEIEKNIYDISKDCIKYGYNFKWCINQYKLFQSYGIEKSKRIFNKAYSDMCKL